jgi:DNA-binding YbaB/EbfC family protein
MNRNDLMRQARQLQERLAKAQEEIENTVVEATAGGGAVKVTLNGKPKVESITIDPDAIDPDDVEMLQDLILAAINEALDKAMTLQAEKMGMFGSQGLKFPGL